MSCETQSFTSRSRASKPVQDSPSADSGPIIQENPDNLLNGAVAREQKRTDRLGRSVELLGMCD